MGSSLVSILTSHQRINNFTTALRLLLNVGDTYRHAVEENLTLPSHIDQRTQSKIPSSHYPSSPTSAPAAVPDYFAVLGVSHDATNDEITKAWRRLVLIHHPDKKQASSLVSFKSHPSESDANPAHIEDIDSSLLDSDSSHIDIRLINEARSILLDPTKREIWQQLFTSSNPNPDHLGVNGKTPVPAKDEGPHVFRHVSLDEFEPHYTSYPSRRNVPSNRDVQDQVPNNQNETNEHLTARNQASEAEEKRKRAEVDGEEDREDDNPDDDEDPQWWSYPCRCSGTFVITLGQLEEGVEVIGCEGCGEWIRVGYQAVDEDNGE
ncbi:hypothetical protein IAT40_001254 [Kwoniella sp. CBS 6097]